MSSMRRRSKTLESGVGGAPAWPGWLFRRSPKPMMRPPGIRDEAKLRAVEGELLDAEGGWPRCGISAISRVMRRATKMLTVAPGVAGSGETRRVASSITAVSG